jgi:hypothetical protein
VSKIINQNVSEYSNLLNTLGATQLDFSGNTYETFELKNNAYPRIYASDCVMQLTAKAILLPYELPLCQHASRPAIINSPVKNLSSSINVRLMEPTDIYRLISKNTANNDIQYSFAKYIPNSFVYPFIRIKENLELEIAIKRNNTDLIRSKRYLFASKRIYELDRWRSDIPTVAGPQCSFYEAYCKFTGITWGSLLHDYENNILANIKEVTTITDSIEREKRIKEANSYVNRDFDRLQDFVLGSSYSEQVKIKLFDQVNVLFDGLLTRLNIDSNETFDTLHYDGLADLSQSGQPYDYFVEQQASVSAMHTTWSKVDLSSKIDGNDLLLDNENLNILTGSQSKFPEVVVRGISSLLINTHSNAESTWTVHSGIKAESYYRLAFDYKTGTTPFIVTVYELNPLAPEAIQRTTIFKASLYNRKDAIRGFVFKTSESTKDLEISVKPLDLSKDNLIDIHEIKLTQLSLPRILVAPQNIKIITPPQIRFEKINESKYVIEVEDVTEPFYLIFNNAFSSRWQLYRRGVSPVGNEVFKFIERLFSFIDNAPLEFMQNKKLSSKHFLINYFANGWLVTPNDLQGSSSATLVLEYAPQGVFYISSFISLVTVLGVTMVVAVYTLYAIFRKLFRLD